LVKTYQVCQPSESFRFNFTDFTVGAINTLQICDSHCDKEVVAQHTDVVASKVNHLFNRKHKNVQHGFQYPDSWDLITCVDGSIPGGIASLSLLIHSVVSLPFFHIQTQSEGHSAAVKEGSVSKSQTPRQTSKKAGLEIISDGACLANDKPELDDKSKYTLDMVRALLVSYRSELTNIIAIAGINNHSDDNRGKHS